MYAKISKKQTGEPVPSSFGIARNNLHKKEHFFIHQFSVPKSNHLNSIELTMSLMENPLVHLINTPDDADVCLTGKENVNPSSPLLATNCSGSPAFSTNVFSDVAIKSKRSCKQET